MIITDKEELTKHKILAVKNEAESKEIILELEKELKNSKIPGCGLSAPQIGIYKAVAIIRLEDIGDGFGKDININLVNPKIISGEKTLVSQEGCLSFPNIVAKAVRYTDICIETMANYVDVSNNIKLELYDQWTPENTVWEKRVLAVNDFAAIVCQHEMAHLINLTFLDFTPTEVGRNELCPCGSLKKNKKCCNFEYFNDNMKKLFNPLYII